MSTFSGASSLGTVQLTELVSSLLDDMDGTFSELFVAPEFELGDESGDGVIEVAPHAHKVGHVSVGFDGELFDKILVFPRSKSLGFVLSENTFQVEVWNTFRNRRQVMTEIDITGSGDLQIADPHSLPLNYWPLESFSFTATVPQDGAAQINNIAVFVFDGIGGTDLKLLGSRLSVFSPLIDWSQPFVERISFKSIILAGWSGKEQRVQLRTIPRPGATYRVVTLTARESAGMDALLWGRKSRVYGVPWWQDAQPLTGPVAEGALSISVDTTLRAFEEGGLVLLWRDQFTFEALTIDTVASGAVTLTTGTTDAWAQLGTLVVPMKRGRLLSTAKISRPAEFASLIDVAFDCEVV